MEATRNQYEFANSIVWRSKERLNAGVSLEEEQINALYYWIMMQMMQKVEKCWPAKIYHEMSFFAEHPKNVGTIRVVSRSKSTAVSEVFVFSFELTEKQFYDIIGEVANIINSLPSFTANYQYTKHCHSASLSISMTTV